MRLIFGYIFLFILILTSMATAESSYIFEQDVTANLRTSCFDTDDTLCGAGTGCYLTVVHPNSSLLVDNGTMTNNVNYYNYSINASLTGDTGVYSSFVECVGDTDAYTTFTFEITPNGEKPTTAQGVLYVSMFSIFVLLFILSITSIFKFKSTYVKFIMLHVSYLLFIAMLYVTWNISVSFLTQTQFLISWTWILFRFFMAMYFAFVLGTIIWMILELRRIKAIQNLMERGIPHDEALERTMRFKKKW